MIDAQVPKSTSGNESEYEAERSLKEHGATDDAKDERDALPSEARSTARGARSARRRGSARRTRS